ncbi:(d)CMP kinase [Clostridium sp.]|uniref:(d)CMP kinase n=1 Tax=Clostridium sp. TaxID=1506 RepID=UPI003994BD52
MNNKITIAIDGPAGAGKSTIAKIISKNLNLIYINTGAMYRAVTLKALEKDIKPSEIYKLESLIDTMDICFINDELILNGENINKELTTPRISNNVSQYASIKEVRVKLVEIMRRMSQKYNVIMDGRDIGTVVLKDANYKFFLTASAEERAERRFKELKDKNIDVEYNNILEEIIKRDYIDSTREVDPLKKASDAIEIDTTGLNIDEVVNLISSYVKK